MCLNHFFLSLQDIIEKYLFEYDYLNPFKLLIYEGIIGSLLWLIYYLVNYLVFKKDYLEEIREIDNENMNFGWIITFFISYFFLSGLKNIYRLLTINIFSPMTRIFTDTMMSPILLLYYYFLTEDFEIKNEKKSYYFIINLIISFIIVFCGAIYNELIVLYCNKLEYETHREVTIRAQKEKEKNDSEESNDSEQSDNSEEKIIIDNTFNSQSTK